MPVNYRRFTLYIAVFACFVSLSCLAGQVASDFFTAKERFKQVCSEIRSESVSKMSALASEYLVTLNQLKDELSADSKAVETVNAEISRFMSARDVSGSDISGAVEKLSILQVEYIEKSRQLQAEQATRLTAASASYAGELESFIDVADESVPESVLNDMRAELAAVRQVHKQSVPVQDKTDIRLPARTKPAANVATGVITDDSKVVSSIFQGRVLKFNAGTLDIHLLYDFTDEKQMEDWQYAQWKREEREDGWEIKRDALYLDRLRAPMLHSAVFSDVTVSCDFEVSGAEGSAGVVAAAERDDSFYCMMGLERGVRGILRKYERGKQTPVSKAHDSPYRVYGKGSVSLTISGSSVLGRLGIQRYKSNDNSAKNGRVGVFAPGTLARFTVVRIEGTLDKRWYNARKKVVERKLRKEGEI